MPGWLKVISHANPLTYMIDGIRALMTGTTDGFPLTIDFTVLVCTTTVLVTAGGKLYNQVIV